MHCRASQHYVDVRIDFWHGKTLVKTAVLQVDTLIEAKHWGRHYDGYFSASQYIEILRRRYYAVPDSVSLEEVRRRFYRYDMPRS